MLKDRQLPTAFQKEVGLGGWRVLFNPEKERDYLHRHPRSWERGSSRRGRKHQSTGAEEVLLPRKRLQRDSCKMLQIHYFMR